MLLSVKIYPPTSKAMLDKEILAYVESMDSNARIVTELYSDFM